MPGFETKCFPRVVIHCEPSPSQSSPWKSLPLKCSAQNIATHSKEATELAESFKVTFKSSLGADLHTPFVVAAFSDPLKFMNYLLHTRKGILTLLPYMAAAIGSIVFFARQRGRKQSS